MFCGILIKLARCLGHTWKELIGNLKEGSIYTFVMWADLCSVRSCLKPPWVVLTQDVPRMFYEPMSLQACFKVGGYAILLNIIVEFGM